MTRAPIVEDGGAGDVSKRQSNWSKVAASPPKKNPSLVTPLTKKEFGRRFSEWRAVSQPPDRWMHVERIRTLPAGMAGARKRLIVSGIVPGKSTREVSPNLSKKVTQIRVDSTQRGGKIGDPGSAEHSEG